MSGSLIHFSRERKIPTPGKTQNVLKASRAHTRKNAMQTDQQKELRRQLARNVREGQFAQITNVYSLNGTSWTGKPLLACFLGAAYHTARLSPPQQGDCPGTMARKRLELRKAYGLTLEQEEQLAVANDSGSTLQQLADSLMEPEEPLESPQEENQRHKTPPKPSNKTAAHRRRRQRKKKSKKR